jgi:hypothetical protein
MKEIVVDHPANEASALLAIENRELLKAHGWEMAFWSCSDEDRVEKALHALGKGRDGWELVRPAKVRAEPKTRTEDAEAMARFGGRVYIFGSHFGTKSGPLEPTRHFIARFREDRLSARLDEGEIELEIARGRFKLHRLLNDALRESGLGLMEPGDEERRCIRETRRKGRKKGKKWAERIHKDDWPVDIEGAAFRNIGGMGALLLGLRYPVTRDGHPVLIEMEGIDKLFRNPPDDPSIRQLWGARASPGASGPLKRMATPSWRSPAAWTALRRRAPSCRTIPRERRRTPASTASLCPKPRRAGAESKPSGSRTWASTPRPRASPRTPRGTSGTCSTTRRSGCGR